MQDAQSATNAIAGYTELFASLQTVQSTVQVQIERFNALMSDFKIVSAARRDEEGVHALGNVALTLHRVHTLLYGGDAAAAPAQPVDQASPASSAGLAASTAENEMNQALNEFSALLANSQGTSQQVGALLDAAAAELVHLHG